MHPSLLMEGDPRPVIAITLGDPNGIGPEVALRALESPDVAAKARCRLVGPLDAWMYWSDRLGLTIADPLSIDEVPRGGRAGSESIEPGRLSGDAGRMAMESVARATDGALSGAYDAIVSAPISKEAIHLAGFAFPGHTEFLAERTRADHFVMMLASGSLRVALLTIHEPIARVAGLVSTDRIRKTLDTLSNTLQFDFGITAPRIAILGLNPHAGDGGVIGREEMDIIQPSIDAAREAGLNVSGPFPADGFFGRRTDKEFDAVLAMYHDQGLAPFKALAMGAGVNVTCGLPIVRTSPDHGTAFGIAGQGVASADSMVEAILLAAEIALKRRGRDDS